MTFTALSVIQPWPWLILRPDLIAPDGRAAARAAGLVKDVENRDWETPVRGWVLLHASKTRLAKWDYQAAALFAAKRGVDVPLQGNVPYGAIVGAVRVDDCVKRSSSRWFTGPHAFALGASVAFAAPVECNGSLKFFPLPPAGAGLGGAELAAALARAIRAAGLGDFFRLEEITA